MASSLHENPAGAASHAEEQRRLWNGPAGNAWVDLQTLLDGMFAPFEQVLLEVVAAAPRYEVLDVGCGTGATTLAVARHLGTQGNCVGVDISEPMLARARVRAQEAGVPATFICADAQTCVLEMARFDLFLSRFGVMFFDRPVWAFTNLRSAAAPGAELCALLWRSPGENPFMTVAERAAEPLLPGLPPRRPGAPGQFAFADDGRVRAILEKAGWSEVQLQALDVECVLPASALKSFALRMGPVGLLLQEADEPTRDRVGEAVLAAYAPYLQGDEVRFTAACWRMSARA